MKLAIILLAALACIPFKPCYAADRLIGDAFTYHSSDCQDAYARTCEPWRQPKRLSWQHDLSEDWSSDIGVGTNSYGKQSGSMGVLYQPLKLGVFQAGGWAAMVSGYTCDQLKTCVLVAGAVVTMTYRRVVMQMLYVPAVGGGTVSVVQMRAGLEF